MLTSGIVPALYEDDEKEGILNQIKQEVQALGGTNFTRDYLWQFFVRVQLYFRLKQLDLSYTKRKLCWYVKINLV